MFSNSPHKRGDEAMIWIAPHCYVNEKAARKIFTSEANRPTEAPLAPRAACRTGSFIAILSRGTVELLERVPDYGQRMVDRGD